MSRLLGAALAVVLCLSFGCESSKPAAASSSPHSIPKVFGTSRGAVTETATKELGQDCTEFRSSDCLSGLCLHTGSLPSEGYVCSKRCADSSECPSTWSCTQVFPSDDGHLCVPPSERVPFEPTEGQEGEEVL
jgi:hypothetical protein